MSFDTAKHENLPFLAWKGHKGEVPWVAIVATRDRKPIACFRRNVELVREVGLMCAIFHPQIFPWYRARRDVLSQ